MATRTRPQRTPRANSYLSTAEAAIYLDVGESTLRGWARQGIITPIRVGPKLLRWRISDLDTMGEV